MEKLCAACKRPFEARGKRVTCSMVCSKNRYTPKLTEMTLTCANCGQTFVGKENRRFCRRSCGEAFYSNVVNLRYPVIVTHPPGTPHLVYLWFDADASLPYYVGCGVRGRETECHFGVRPPARVEITCEQMSLDDARIAEAAIISAMLLLGAPLCNERAPRA